MIWKQFLYLSLWFCLMDRHRTLCFAQWTGTRMFAFGSWQGTAGSQRLELTVANVGNTDYHCKELPVPRGWNSCLPNLGTREVTIAKNFRFLKVGTDCFQPGNLRLPLQATAGSHLGTTGYHCKELPVPKGWNWWFPTGEPKVTIASNCRFPEVGTHASQPETQRLPL